MGRVGELFAVEKTLLPVEEAPLLLLLLGGTGHHMELYQ